LPCRRARRGSERTPGYALGGLATLRSRPRATPFDVVRERLGMDYSWGVSTCAVDTRRASVSLVSDDAHYKHVTCNIAQARTSVWIATANVKQMLVEAPIGSRDRARGRYVSILDTLQSLCDRGVRVRLLHAAPPSRPFRDELERRAARLTPPGFEIRACPRVHLKMVAIDGSLLYLGSANFTGAGLGAKGAGRRNFEMGIVTDDEWMLDVAQERFDRIWRGAECGACRLRRVCPDPLDRPRVTGHPTSATSVRAAKTRRAAGEKRLTVPVVRR
jgi:phosphatidylserine/phosphatidylglycerophosphate/cardiolipin synthase-like enzyme